MANTVTNVSAGKPNIEGAIYVAPLGSTIPTDCTTDLAGAFACLGYCSDAGLVNTNTAETTEINAWGGDVVLSIQNSKPDTFKFTLIETLSVDVLKAVYGDGNVEGTLETGIKVSANSEELSDHIWVIEMVLRNNAIKRIVIPVGKVTTIDDISYTDEAVIGYGITLTAAPDTSGNTHYEYIKRTSSTS